MKVSLKWHLCGVTTKEKIHKQKIHNSSRTNSIHKVFLDKVLGMQDVIVDAETRANVKYDAYSKNMPQKQSISFQIFMFDFLIYLPTV